jgi:hypothetical protein
MAKKLKVPKRIGGVKIPKSIRKGPVGSFLNSSTGQLLVAEAILAVGGVLAARNTDPHSPAGTALRHPLKQLGRASRATVHRGSRAKEALADGTDRFAQAFGEGVAAFRAAFEREPSQQQFGESEAKVVNAETIKQFKQAGA